MKARKHFRNPKNLPLFVYEDEEAIRNGYREYHNFSDDYDNHCDKIDQYANKRVIEELEMILDRTQFALNLDSIRKHIASQIKLKQDE